MFVRTGNEKLVRAVLPTMAKPPALVAVLPIAVKLGAEMLANPLPYNPRDPLTACNDGMLTEDAFLIVMLPAQIRFGNETTSALPLELMSMEVVTLATWVLNSLR